MSPIPSQDRALLDAMLQGHDADPGADGLIVDLFAGGGGASVGIEAALGRSPDLAINHDPVALAVHRANHPSTLHLDADIWEVQPEEATGGRPVELLWASPDCRHHSRAKGGKPTSERVRSLADVVVRWAGRVRPRIICVENVEEFRDWGPLGDDDRPTRALKGAFFERWSGNLQRLGYAVESRLLTACDYGAPTSRRRLFIVARCDGEPIAWPEPTHGAGLRPYRTAADAIDWSIPARSIFERSRPLAEKTQRRIAAGIRRFVIEAEDPFIINIEGEHAVPTLIQTGYGERPTQRPRVPGLHKPLGTIVAGGAKHALVTAWIMKFFGGVVGVGARSPLGTVTAVDHHAIVTAELERCDLKHARKAAAFLLKYYGSATGQRLDEPAHTITSIDRLGLVVVELEGEPWVITDIGLRMLQPAELLRAQFGRFAQSYSLSAAKTKRDKVRLVGNSVCPELAEAIVAAQFAAVAQEVAA